MRDGMVRGRRRVLGGGILAALLPCGEALSQAARSLGPRDALRRRQRVLLLVSPPDAALPDSEAIGDWAHDLDEALRDRPAGVTVSRLTRSGFRELVAEPVLRQDHATVFVRPDHSALLHEGLVLDPPIYETGFAFLNGAEPPSRPGLILTRLRLR